VKSENIDKKISSTNPQSAIRNPQSTNPQSLEVDRYSRQILFSGIGKEGQQRLNRSRATLIGCGALGSMHAEMLSRAGVGFLRIVDRDFIEGSNLHRQVLFEERDVAERNPKAVAAADRIARINAEIVVEPIVKDVNYANIEELIHDVDLVLDGADNFEVRYLLNDAAIKLGKPWIYGAAVGAYGAQMTIRPGVTPCLRCIFEEAPPPGTSPTCDTTGVILPIIAAVASYQVTEAIKLLVGQEAKLHGSLLQIDLWQNTYTKLKLRERTSDCPACGRKDFEFLRARGGQLATTLCGRNAVQITPANPHEIDFAELASQLREAGEVSYNHFLLKFNAEGREITVFRDARVVIKGTEDLALARSLYARYIGA
jgi:molybdopterin/thiamine biosynthesis adenylyltransferase